MSAPDSCTLSQLLLALGKSSEQVEEAAKVLKAARDADLSARNRLCALQRQIDEKMDAMRKAAPRDSDWWAKAHVQRGEPGG